MKTYKDRLSELLTKSGMSNAELARKIQVSAPTITYWLGTRTKGLKYDDAVRIADVFGVSPDWLIYGEEKDEKESQESTSDQTIYLKKVNLRASCGTLCAYEDKQNDADVIDGLRVGVLWFKNNFPQYQPQNVQIVTASGDSMEPLIKDGDLVFVDVSKNECDRDGVYFLFLDGQYFIKRVQRSFGRRLILISDNNKYRDIEINADSQVEFHTIGRVIKTFKSTDI